MNNKKIYKEDHGATIKGKIGRLILCFFGRHNWSGTTNLTNQHIQGKIEERHCYSCGLKHRREATEFTKWYEREN